MSKTIILLYKKIYGNCNRLLKKSRHKKNLQLCKIKPKVESFFRSQLNGNNVPLKSDFDKAFLICLNKKCLERKYIKKETFGKKTVLRINLEP